MVVRCTTGSTGACPVVSSSEVAVAVVVNTAADGRYVGLVLGQPRLQDPTVSLDGRLVR